jgi:ABC-2 type transport system ATP-binding protein
MVEVRNITKRYGPLVAVDDVSFTVGQGRVLGFIGPNGAGKTSTMRILTGFLPATQGTVTVDGHDVFDEPLQVKRKVGYLPETPPLYRELTVGNYLQFVAELRELTGRDALKRIGTVMDLVGLHGWERRILGSLSKGYRQRVGLAQALLHDPPVLVLDEPTSGLDPAQVVGVRGLIGDLAQDRTVILSTHILREVEAVCDDVVLICKGKVLAQGTMDHVRTEAAPVRYRVQVGATDADQVARALGDVDGVDQVEPAADGAFLLAAGSDPRPAVAAAVVGAGWELISLSEVRPSLEDAFLRLVGGATL